MRVIFPSERAPTGSTVPTTSPRTGPPVGSTVSVQASLSRRGPSGVDSLSASHLSLGEGPRWGRHCQSHVGAYTARGYDAELHLQAGAVADPHGDRHVAADLCA